MVWDGLHFIRPYMLLALLPAVVLVVLLWRSKLSQALWTTVCDEALLPYLLQEKPVNAGRGLLITGAVAAFLAIITLAGPTWQRLPAPAFRNASALVIALDLSRSMDAEDIKPSRLIRARYKIADLLKQRKDGQTALLVYSGAAFTVTPLTDDSQTIDSQLSALTTGMMPSPGSNAVEAINKAVALFKQAGLQKGQIVLVTDGVDLETSLPAVMALDGYQLSILGVGTPDGAPIPADGGFVKDAQGTIIIPKLNIDDLNQLAQAGGGVYQTITVDDADIQTLLARFNLALQQNDDAKSHVMLELWDDKGPWVLLLVLPLAALIFRKGVLLFAFCLLIPFPENSYALGWQDLWQTPDQQAQKKYQQRNFSEAAGQFNDPQWKAAAHYQAGEYDKALQAYQSSPQKENSDYFYNQGNALARTGGLEQALKAYDQALAIKPDDADTLYNKEMVAKELAKQQQDKKNQAQQHDKQSSDDKSDNGQDKQDPQDKQNQQNQQNGDDNGQKPQAKPERPDSESSAQPQQGARQSTEKPDSNKERQKSANETATEAGQKQVPEQRPQAQEQPALSVESAEQQQANEQWLKRIPDDPAGLLKRKFKYQYNQRGQQADEKEAGW
ncbi:MAG: VWA domain-containing protein [Methylovulum sp.]|uniref:VWA domain-containing protein n=1 Tax=Methylovulum sp. TaxID=1916980 RepID=UPI00261E5B21|nr:VWA domain-containing protein [Methylovulum sp.]MDD2724802.1 VWA domain-containing protein [Methylovulum sp.]MDD5126112.1 VWA domain-containing protein [Methylovulum sp.]